MPVYERTIVSKDSGTYPWISDCGVVGCYYIVSARTKIAAELQLAIHNCPLEGVTKGMSENTPANAGKSIVEKLWDMLDNDVNMIKSDSINTEWHKAHAAGLAAAIALMAVPYFTDTAGVSREALRRWQMRNGDIDFEPTPSYQYNPPPAGTRVTEPRAPRPVVIPPSLTNEDKVGIKFAMEGRTFTAEQVASAYKVSAEVVRAVVAEVGS